MKKNIDFERVEEYKAMGVTKFTVKGEPNMVYKFNRDLFLEPGTKVDGSLDLRYSKGKKLVNKFMLNKSEE